MNRLERELISRIAMFVLAAILIVGGLAVIFATIWYILPADRKSRHGGISERLLVFGGALVLGGLYFLISVFRRSVDTDREPEDPKYRIK